MKVGESFSGEVEKGRVSTLYSRFDLSMASYFRRGSILLEITLSYHVNK